VHALDLGQELAVAQRPRTGHSLAGFDGVERRRGDLQHTADRLDPEHIAVLVDEHR